MGTYATPEQLAAYTGKPAPADAERLLARASADIDDALLTACYPVTSTGAPADPAHAQALADAACAQVEYLLAAGEDGTGASARWLSVSAGSVSLSANSSLPTALDLAPRALRELQRAGLTGHGVHEW
ncbi:hypothetical protein [Kitasatospora phosalacinea]|uniref:Uncharacterized protein n=1 Tax=Kitasatospora phosalacinea TaxID=2065 RepID=A0A9W6UN66_9ACTN|nr:hypothetical protein [Kitasatospora phosalacinea]GLW53968.1 hypothetical protein Kpho01_19790 [Kitasatospora phosalacinea]